MKKDSGWQFPKALEIIKCEEGNAADPAPFPSMVVIYNGERVKNE